MKENEKTLYVQYEKSIKEYYLMKKDMGGEETDKNKDIGNLSLKYLYFSVFEHIQKTFF